MRAGVGTPLEPDMGVSGNGIWSVRWSKVKKKENQSNLDTSSEVLMTSHAGSRKNCNLEITVFALVFLLFYLTPPNCHMTLPDTPISGSSGWAHQVGQRQLHLEDI